MTKNMTKNPLSLVAASEHVFATQPGVALDFDTHLEIQCVS
jgi:hypothetical protein